MFVLELRHVWLSRVAGVGGLSKGLDLRVGGAGVWLLGESGADALPGGRDGGGPAPGGVDAQPSLAGASGDAGRDVQDPVAESVDLAAGQLGGVGESDELGPGDQIGGGQDDLQPGGVEVVAGQVGQAGGFGFPDAVLDAGVLARGVDARIDQPPHRCRGGLRPEHVLAVPAQLPDSVNAVRSVGHRGSQIGDHRTRGVHPGPLVGVGQ